jgi:hypothetical protein
VFLSFAAKPDGIIPPLAWYRTNWCGHLWRRGFRQSTPTAPVLTSTTMRR